jgi:ribosomal peptide maturation radical SAM protein 1
MKVLIIVPPFASLDYPSIEASVLKSAVHNEGHEAKVLYLNKEFAAFLGPEAYREIAEIPPTYGAAEWVGIGRISSSIYPETNVKLRAHKHFIDYLNLECEIDQATVARLKFAKICINDFVEKYRIDRSWENFDLIFVCCRHQQLGFAAMLGNALKSAEVRAASYLFGQQVNTEEQAREITRVFSHFSGVIYQMNPLLVAKNLVNLANLERVSGVYNRSWDNNALDPSLQIRNLATIPDFSDFFVGNKGRTYSVLPFQMSHGCWWAEKSHCNFCGLIQQSEEYLSLGSNSAQENLQKLVEDNEILHIVFADHLFDTRQPDEALEIPILTQFDTSFFCELKSNTPKKKLEKLVSLGLTTAEFGIESFDENTLKTIGKGVTVFQNICALKWSLELGISAFWSWIIGFKGETEESIDSQISFAKKLFHLPPPLHVTRVRLERRSPLFSFPEENGMEHIRPQEAFLHTFPYSAAALSLISNYFDYRSIENEELFETKLRCIQGLVQEWRETWRPNQLYYLRGPGFVKICDARRVANSPEGAVKEIILRDWRAEVFKRLDIPSRIGSLQSFLSKRGAIASTDQLIELLAELSKLGLICKLGDRWINIVPRVNIQKLSWERAQKGWRSL